MTGMRDDQAVAQVAQHVLAHEDVLEGIERRVARQQRRRIGEDLRRRLQAGGEHPVDREQIERDAEHADRRSGPG